MSSSKKVQDNNDNKELQAAGFGIDWKVNELSKQDLPESKIETDTSTKLEIDVTNAESSSSPSTSLSPLPVAAAASESASESTSNSLRRSGRIKILHIKRPAAPDQVQSESVSAVPIPAGPVIIAPASQPAAFASGPSSTIGQLPARTGNFNTAVKLSKTVTVQPANISSQQKETSLTTENQV
jgi:hypothetical protein